MATELQTAFQLSTPTGGADMHMLLILIVMVVAGALGGVANYFLADRPEKPERRDWLRYPILGVVVALTAPLFLNMISSTLLEGARTRPVDFFTFAGFCLIYVIASRRLTENVAQRLLGQFDQLRREVGQLQQEKQEEEAARAAPPVVEEPREALSYNDVEILRALAEESFVCGNLAAICERTGQAREFVSHRLTVMKGLGVIETRINDKNVLHWVVSARGKTVLDDILAGQDEPHETRPLVGAPR